jgi:RNA methyltransferase, TrmH family
VQLGKHSPRWKSFLKLDKHSGLFLVEGPKLLEEARRGNHPLRHVVFDPQRWRPTFADVPGYEVTADMLQRLSDAHTCQGVVGLAEKTPWSSPANCATLVIAEEMSDPGNLGTLLRTAWAAGVAGVALIGGVDPFSPKVVRASAGAIFHLPVFQVTDLAGLGERTLIGLTPHAGKELYEVEWPQRWGLLVGNEAHGLSAAALHSLHLQCRIPMAAGCESLNAAVSAAIVVFEWRRKVAR